jgi:RIP homotypic interaction motif
MNPFADLQNDTVYIANDEGHRSGPYKTNISSKGGLSASIFVPSLDVEEGWKLIRILPGGKEESYTVLEVNFSNGLPSGGIPAHWTLKLEKDSSLIRRQASTQGPTIHISNSQGIQIGDHNVQHIANSLTGLIEKIEGAKVSSEAKAVAKGQLATFLSNPTVAAVLGGAVDGLLSLLGH